MNIMGVQSVLSILLLVATVKADKGNVEFWREEFTMTCPGNGTWFKHSGEKDPPKVAEPNPTYSIEYNSDNKGLYSYPTTTTTKNKYYFYVKGKVCANCFEVDATLFALVIIVDVVGTAFVMIIIYTYTKRKSPGGPTHSSKGKKKNYLSKSQKNIFISGYISWFSKNLPHVPWTEQLNPRTRSHDTYSIVNRTG
uniref:CD3e molecule n=1 Tax=Seriola lalandi dorsalis TaxID=1841481 RepID=A0A3B4X6H7_SERLL